MASKKHLRHVHTRRKAPWTNGVIERCFGSLKNERLHHDIADAVQLAAHWLQRLVARRADRHLRRG